MGAAAFLISEFFSVTISPAAAFKQTAFEKSLSSPLNIFIILSALYCASSPSKSLNLFAPIFNSLGSIIISEILPSFN